ncbi:hypothetical protein NG799_05495 [Laspinema sp. D1]|uniref:Uncharacterized protein n=1 Tax=Laspinema palackyanum D2a TaxID=2953684 RepID=A0ABT2MM13_9CYAN|nr:hypothetical protein [Laspinema sp. D2a]
MMNDLLIGSIFIVWVEWRGWGDGSKRERRSRSHLELIPLTDTLLKPADWHPYTHS